MKAAEREARDISGIKDDHIVYPKCLSQRPHHLSPQHQRNKLCYCCGSYHNLAHCFFINEECFYSQSMCLKKRKHSNKLSKSPQEQQYGQSERKQNEVTRKFI